MNAMIVVKTKNGYAVAPYEGDLPPNFVQDMEIATHLTHYGYDKTTVVRAMEAFFEPEPATELKVAA
jgi:hypothetical protein